MKRTASTIAIAALLLAAASASAHLDSLLVPKGGMAYYAGSNLVVWWTIGNNHNGIDVHLSTDDKTWTTLAADLPKTALKYSWNLPAQTCESARIRVCQKSGPAGCTEADSVSNPADGPLYILVSGRFRIVAAPASITTSSGSSTRRASARWGSAATSRCSPSTSSMRTRT